MLLSLFWNNRKSVMDSTVLLHWMILRNRLNKVYTLMVSKVNDMEYIMDPIHKGSPTLQVLQNEFHMI